MTESLTIIGGCILVVIYAAFAYWFLFDDDQPGSTVPPEWDAPILTRETNRDGDKPTKRQKKGN